MIELVEAGLRHSHSTASLLYLGAKLLILQLDQNLAGFDSVALLYADPRDATGYLRVHADGVVGYDVAGGLKDRVAAACARALGHCTSGLDLGNRCREEPNHERDDSQDHNRSDAGQNEPIGPFWSFRLILRALDAQAVQIPILGF